nr:unnamed protein product [Callosobruchus analis]
MSGTLAHSLDEGARTRDVLTREEITFDSLLLPNHIFEGLKTNGFKKPSPIQLKAIPVGRCGFDIIVKSKSGTGKTIVFTVVALETIDTTKKYPTVLILCPTREIAVQVQEVVQLVGCCMEGRTESVTNILNRYGWQAICIHAGQKQPERLAAMEKFKSFKCRILASTDLTARGIDAANVDLVINFDVPSDAMTYLHRMGRAGRYGSTGACINITLKEELPELQKVLGCIGGSGITVPKLPEFAGSIQDLLKTEVAPENCINGIVSETPVKDIRSRINELKKGKQAGNQKQKTATKMTKKAKREARTLEAAQNGVSEMDTNATGLNSSKEEKESLQSNNEEKENLDDPMKEIKKEVDEMDNSAILASLASGTFQFDSLPQTTQTNKRTEEDITVSVKNMRSPTSSSGSNKHCLKKPKREDIYCKNKALLDVTKILINADSVKAEDTSLQECLDTLKLNEKDKVSKYSGKDIPELLDAIKSEGSTMEEESKEEESSGSGGSREVSSSNKKIGDVDMERVFEVAYNTIVRSAKDDKLEAYLEKLRKTRNGENLNGSVSMVVNDGLSEDSEECDEPVEIMKWVPDTTLWVLNQNQDEVVEDEDEDNLDGDVGEDDRYDGTNEVEMSRWMPAGDGSAADLQQQYRRQYAVQTAQTDVERYDHFQQYFQG